MHQSRINTAIEHENAMVIACFQALAWFPVSSPTTSSITSIWNSWVVWLTTGFTLAMIHEGVRSRPSGPTLVNRSAASKSATNHPAHERNGGSRITGSQNRVGPLRVVKRTPSAGWRRVDAFSSRHESGMTVLNPWWNTKTPRTLTWWHGCNETVRSMLKEMNVPLLETGVFAG